MMSAVEPVQKPSANVAFVDVPTEPDQMDAGEGPSASSMVQLQRHYNDFTGRIRHQMSLVRPWRDFFDHSSFAFPRGISGVVSRLNYNMNYYYHNYIVLAFIGAALVMFLNPAFVICAVITMAMWWYIGTKRLEAAETNSNHFMLGKTEITFTKAYLCVFIFALFSFFATNGSSVLFWLIASSLGIVLLHASLCQPSSEVGSFVPV